MAPGARPGHDGVRPWPGPPAWSARRAARSRSRAPSSPPCGAAPGGPTPPRSPAAGVQDPLRCSAPGMSVDDIVAEGVRLQGETDRAGIRRRSSRRWARSGWTTPCCPAPREIPAASASAVDRPGPGHRARRDLRRAGRALDASTRYYSWPRGAADALGWSASRPPSQPGHRRRVPVSTGTLGRSRWTDVHRGAALHGGADGARRPSRSAPGRTRGSVSTAATATPSICPAPSARP